MKVLASITSLTLILLSMSSIALGVRQPAERDFQVIERGTDKKSGKTVFYLHKKRGTERTNNSLNRLSILSEDQRDYPSPESGCGPTAMLNILVWYEKYGLIEPRYRDADPKHYKFKLFREIDRRLNRQAGQLRTEETGVSNLDAAMVMDAMVRERSKGIVRIHTDAIAAPLKLIDMLDTMQNFRSGYLIVAPKDRNTGKMLNDHAATVIRADRAGYITLATWGVLYRGLLKQRADGQWFIPQNPEHMELKVHGLTRFIPFRPTAAVDQSPRLRPLPPGAAPRMGNTQNARPHAAPQRGRHWHRR